MPLDQPDSEELGKLPEPEPAKGKRKGKKAKAAKEEPKEMSFLEHLEELRGHIIRSISVISVLGIGLFFLKDWLFGTVIFGPSKGDFISYKIFCKLGQWFHAESTLCFSPPEFTTQAVGFAEAFVTAIKVSFIAGFIVAFPYVFWEFWKFISPGLYDKEKRAARGVVAVCTFLFLSGVAFGYFMIAPFAISFLTNFTLPGVSNIPTLNSLINYMVMFTLPTGLVFEMPVVVYFLARIGLLSPETMKEYRRHSIVGILIVAAVITPPDVASQILVSGPLLVLYELSIFIARYANKLHEKEVEGQEA